MQWGDACYPCGLMTGLPAVGTVGTAPCYGIFPAQPHEITHSRTWSTAALRPGMHDEFLLSQGLVDADKGFGTHRMTWSELPKMARGQSFRLLPLCFIAQPVARRGSSMMQLGGQPELSSDANKLVLCNALRPSGCSGGLDDPE